MQKDIALVVLPILAAVVSWFLTRRKTRAETKLIELECAEKLIQIYKGALDEVQKELILAREEIAKSRVEIAKLREEVETLSKLNRKLDSELKQFRKEHATETNMQLTSNFSLEELTRSADATKLKIANRPSVNEISNLRALAENVLQPLRDAVGVISINSGYRCKKLNDAVGGSDTSQHMLGQAADFKCADMAKAFDHIKENLPFDQLIWEHGNDTQPDWIHVSYSPRHRKQVIRIK